MTACIRAPRINNNDDSARVVHVYAQPGAFLRQGEPLADLETDKATFTVEAEQDCYLLRFDSPVGSTVAVGSILAWVGDSASEEPPGSAAAGPAQTRAKEPTLKASILLSRYGLRADEVPASGERLSAGDVERYAAGRQLRPRNGPAAEIARPPSPPSEPGRAVELTRAERGMLAAVNWHKQAVPGYLELFYDARPWEEHAAAVQKEHRFLMSPLLPLFARRLARIAAQNPNVNATVFGEQRYVYDQVNLGFTVQSGSNLYAVVVRDAGKLALADFIKVLNELQRTAMKNALRPEQVSGATIGFSSMARWQVTRHVPVLLPYTGVMVAHSAPREGTGCLGITYDHRLLHGADAYGILQALSQPSESDG